jgi:hypothetical protein
MDYRFYMITLALAANCYGRGLHTYSHQKYVNDLESISAEGRHDIQSSGREFEHHIEGNMEANRGYNVDAQPTKSWGEHGLPINVSFRCI